jgi:ribosome-binding protein aMBF1 (putative translation factor)
MAEQIIETLTGRVLRGARVVAGLSQQELGRQVLGNADTISRLESFGAKPIRCQARTLMMIELMLKSHGVQISPDGRNIHLIDGARHGQGTA